MLAVFTLSNIVAEYDSKPFYLRMITPPAIAWFKKLLSIYKPGEFLNAKDLTTLVNLWKENPQIFSKLKIPEEFKDFLTLIEKLHKGKVLTAVHISKFAQCNKTAVIKDLIDILECVFDESTVDFLTHHLNKTAAIKNIVFILKNSKLLSKYYSHIIRAEQPLLQQISALLSSVCTTENDDKVILGGLTTYDELAFYFESEKTICALTQLFLYMKKYELLDDRNINKILQYADGESIIDLVSNISKDPYPKKYLIKSLQKTPEVVSIRQAWVQQQKIVLPHQRFLIENGYKITVRGKNPIFITETNPKRSNAH